jgi:CubicO group peptidase (beta-lactamase class C family)
MRSLQGNLKIAGCAVLLVLGSAGSSARSEVADERFERVAAVVVAEMRELGVPGAALGIFYEGKALTRGFGVTSVENPLPVTPDTLFQIGSITKTFTATVVMRLVEAGKLELGAPVRKVMPAFRVRDEEASRSATVLTLLTHMGGWEGDLFDDAGNGDDALGRVVDRMAGLEQVTPFNSSWSYNNAGFLLAGRLVELATGKPYEAALGELLIQPLGLRDTLVFPSDVMTRRFAVGHAGPLDKPFVLRPWPIPRSLAPAGGLAASVGDLLRYAEFHLGDGAAPGGARLLSRDSMRRMQQTQVAIAGTDGDEMAIGWQVRRIGELREIWHDGFSVGQQALVSMVPSRGLAVALLANSVRAEGLLREVRRAVAREYLGVTLSDPAPLAVPRDRLLQYAGRYSRPFMDLVVTVEGDRLLVQTIQKQGFPTPASPVAPPGPPTPYALYAPDRLIALAVAEAGTRAQFLRRPDGTIGWLRFNGRVARRLPG